ncbi:hypothetical protein THAOC_05176 [Thalassiosira oceanica]|uniref:PDZ domain-containing protein n=1 Tax=Thalassiosira oceanica TaxID=159749 RepID=K0TN63_THAOC|nr:hypothetical protein THAOC_05176 [Thalassiosira oceanica]|eukprot:EJK73212.1 hypothetical protein THAOC_05176 [Thalassiosira oceanica]
MWTRGKVAANPISDELIDRLATNATEARHLGKVAARRATRTIASCTHGDDESFNEEGEQGEYDEGGYDTDQTDKSHRRRIIRRQIDHFLEHATAASRNLKAAATEANKALLDNAATASRDLLSFAAEVPQVLTDNGYLKHNPCLAFVYLEDEEKCYSSGSGCEDRRRGERQQRKDGKRRGGTEKNGKKKPTKSDGRGVSGLSSRRGLILDQVSVPSGGGEHYFPPGPPGVGDCHFFGPSDEEDGRLQSPRSRRRREKLRRLRSKEQRAASSASDVEEDGEEPLRPTSSGTSKLLHYAPEKTRKKSPGHQRRNSIEPERESFCKTVARPSPSEMTVTTKTVFVEKKLGLVVPPPPPPPYPPSESKYGGAEPATEESKERCYHDDADEEEYQIMIKSFDEEFDEDYSKLLPTQELRRVPACSTQQLSREDVASPDGMQGSAFPIWVLSLDDFDFPAAASVPVKYDFDRAVFPFGDESFEVAPDNVIHEDSSDKARLGAASLDPVNTSVDEFLDESMIAEISPTCLRHPPLRSPPKSLAPRMDSPLQSRIDALHFNTHEWKVLLHPPSSDEKEGRAFLKTTCLGPVVQSAPPFGLGCVLQLGDVLVKLNDEDVSRLDAKGAQHRLDGLVGEVVCLSFLRKTMVV